ncbi:MAG: GNAT family N-acetyltransferase [Ruminococcaceae bacterium]|nr:GNAT family N-acetyltransferase [Oscillospiraceae bacterium]
MELIRITQEHMNGLIVLQRGYKQEIGESAPGEEDFERLLRAMENGQIVFFGCIENDRLVGCCSISPTFSTFDYQRGGVFEDFYILPEYRHRGIARKLVEFAYQESGVSSLTVGCADCDAEIYKALGFDIRLGNMYAYYP